MNPVLRPRHLQAAPHPDLLLVSLADISPHSSPHPHLTGSSPHPGSSRPPLQPEKKKGATNTGSPATIWEPSSLSGPHSHNLHTPAFLPGPARAAAIAYRAMPSSRARAPPAISGLSSRWHNPAYTLFPPGTAHAVAAAYRAPTLIPYLDQSLYLGLSLHLHLSLPPYPPLPVLLYRPTHPPFPSPTRISYNRESRLSAASHMSNGCGG
ncbi:hypothetical protein B0H13DRAFT_2432198 [Mycena leptocephala]|nr:hypothetical protein B0H13DRAFT_2432198 [Mycena leptocephala]